MRPVRAGGVDARAVAPPTSSAAASRSTLQDAISAQSKHVRSRCSGWSIRWRRGSWIPRRGSGCDSSRTGAIAWAHQSPRVAAHLLWWSPIPGMTANQKMSSVYQSRPTLPVSADKSALGLFGPLRAAARSRRARTRRTGSSPRARCCWSIQGTSPGRDAHTDRKLKRESTGDRPSSTSDRWLTKTSP